MHSCWTSGDAPQDIAWGFDMSVENEARPQGPSKVSRRNLIAGAAVAVPAAAVLNASSAWAKPVVNSLIGMPALVASTSYTFSQLFQFTPGTGTRHPNGKSITVSGVSLKNISGEALSGTVSISVPTGYVANPTFHNFSSPNNLTDTFSFTVTKSDGGKFASPFTFTVLLSVVAAGTNNISKTVAPPGFDVTA